jgi:hypothetical protein
MGEALARLERLRDGFARFACARKRLAAIPEIGVSDDGQPYIREVAEALQSFAAWLGELTLDDMGLCGPAYRIHGTLNGLDAIADWVGLHRSQQFAIDIREHVIELFKQSEALDAAVSAAFTVKRTTAQVVKSRNHRVPQAKREAIEEGIQSVAGLAEHLAVRLQRIAIMAGSSPSKTGGSSKPVGRPQNDEDLARDLLAGWKAFEPEDGRKTKERYLAQRADVRTLKTPEAKQRKIASLRVALESAQHLSREKTKQKRRARG